MLIIGAKGHAVEVFQCMPASDYAGLAFYDDVDGNLTEVFATYPVCKSHDQAQQHFARDPRYILGLGGTQRRRQLAQVFSQLGGICTSVVASTATVSSYSQLGNGINIMHGCLVAPNTTLGNGVLLNAGAAVHHDVMVGDYCEISPGARLLGRCRLGADVAVGAGAIILPDITIGEGTVIGAGAVVTHNLSAGSRVAGVPARSITKSIL